MGKNNKNSKIIAVDFDGTCVTHDFPKIGEDIGAIPVLKALVDNGHRLILWTVRSEQFLDEAVKWFADNGIPLFGVNDNPEQSSWSSSRKVYAHYYIDDMAMGTPLIINRHKKPYVDWIKIRKTLLLEGLIPHTVPANLIRMREEVAKHIGGEAKYAEF